MKTTTLVIMSLLLAGSVHAQNPSARDLIEQSRKATRLDGLESVTRLEIHDGKGHVRIRETTMASKIYPDNTEKRVIVFTAPADVKGTAMLIFDYPDREDDMWLYLPSLRKVRKIVSSEKSRSFMGSEFSNADLSIGTLDDFNYRLDGTETIDGTTCWIVRITPANEQIKSTYNLSSKTLWIAKKDKVPRKASFIDQRGKPWKALTYSGIKIMDQKHRKYFVTHMKIRNLQNGRFSVMNMDKAEYNPNVKDSYFTRSFLEQ